jgi:hypothetical protein
MAYRVDKTDPGLTQAYHVQRSLDTMDCIQTLILLLADEWVQYAILLHK